MDKQSQMLVLFLYCSWPLVDYSRPITTTCAFMHVPFILRRISVNLYGWSPIQ